MNSLIENESPPVMDFTLDNGLYDEYIQLASETSEEDEDVDYMLNRDFVDVGFFDGDAMETQVKILHLRFHLVAVITSLVNLGLKWLGMH